MIFPLIRMYTSRTTNFFFVLEPVIFNYTVIRSKYQAYDHLTKLVEGSMKFGLHLA